MHFSKVTANLMARDIAASLKFYQQTLGLERQITVPEHEPFVFVAVGAGNIEIFLNKNEGPAAPIAGGISLYIEVAGLEQLLSRVTEHQVKIEIPLNETFYGMREFAVLDPDGYLLIFAERISK
jgi:lactoylglutathione lyase